MKDILPQGGCVHFGLKLSSPFYFLSALFFFLFNLINQFGIWGICQHSAHKPTDYILQHTVLAASIHCSRSQSRRLAWTLTVLKKYPFGSGCQQPGTFETSRIRGSREYKRDEFWASLWSFEHLLKICPSVPKSEFAHASIMNRYFKICVRKMTNPAIVTQPQLYWFRKVINIFSNIEEAYKIEYPQMLCKQQFMRLPLMETDFWTICAPIPVACVWAAWTEQWIDLDRLLQKLFSFTSFEVTVVLV